jgi:hypothetical protein
LLRKAPVSSVCVLPSTFSSREIVTMLDGAKPLPLTITSSVSWMQRVSVVRAAWALAPGARAAAATRAARSAAAVVAIRCIAVSTVSDRADRSRGPRRSGIQRGHKPTLALMEAPCRRT